MEKTFLTPGPSHIHPVAKTAAIAALNSDICSLSHRSKEYAAIQTNTESQLRRLLSVPDGYEVFFISSGTEGWERVLQGGTSSTSLHLVNGEFSRRFFETATELGKNASSIEAPFGKGFDFNDIPKNHKAELFCVTHNETSSGVSLSDGLFPELRAAFSDSLIAVDAVSSAPFPEFSLSYVDFYFFSVQKFFGMPAGLAVLIVSPKAIAKARALRDKGSRAGAHHNLINLLEFSKKNQTPCTPNVLAIFTLGEVAKHFNERGNSTLRAETRQKAGILYGELDKCRKIKAFVSEERWRSQTVITAQCSSADDATNLWNALAKRSLIVGLGYGKLKDTQLRIANFAAHSVEAIERVCTVISEFDCGTK